MNLELILWIVAWFLTSEVVFILALKYWVIEGHGWVLLKSASFLFVSAFFSIQGEIVHGGNSNISEWFNEKLSAI